MGVTCFIEFKAFQHGNESFQIKELCILDADKPLKPLSFLFKPSTAWDMLNYESRRTYKYQEEHLHKLTWSEGDTSPFSKLCVYRA